MREWEKEGVGEEADGKERKGGRDSMTNGEVQEHRREEGRN